MSYLNAGLPAPAADALDGPYWEGLRGETLCLQRCRSCQRFQWGPEWLCHRCLSFDLDYQPVDPIGNIYSFERVWHPVHPALQAQGPYLIVLVRLPQADDVRVVGNLLGDPRQVVPIGAQVQGVFEHHPAGEFTLLQWRLQVTV
ncbi:MAG: OB-fold domain-containing protein [Pseudomonadales bacterium]|nr:OB-fold domain-containing protein [Pseudomonadales bacterium]